MAWPKSPEAAGLALELGASGVGEEPIKDSWPQTNEH